ncbi:MAG TPA: phytanoyl-CoA dioxygenase family protein [Chthonomonadaceae bacterium]|nr:phytanoyl-CoA dioxygenase family protein [Chthonomonadaceae bacterium]
MKLPQEKIEQFRRDGYLAVGPVLTAQELEAARAAYDRIFQATEKPATYRNLGQKEGEERSEGAVLQIIDMHTLDDIFRHLLYKEEILDLAESILGTPDIRLYHDQALYKPALHGDIVPWHQDNGYWRLEPPNAASLWIALDAATTENGCMWVIPGSHRAGEVGHQRAGQYIAQLKADADESLAVPVPLPAGSAMFHHCRTLHCTRPNRSPYQRRAWVIHYMPADTRQGGNYLSHRPLLRGQARLSGVSQSSSGDI